VADPPLLEVDRLRLPAVGIRDDDVGLDALVAHRQDRDARLPAGGQGGGHRREGITRVEHPCADEVGRQVAVAQPEPGRVGVVGGQFLLDRPGLAGPAPAPLLVDAAAEGVDDRVEIGADPQAVQRHVVAGVDDGGDLRLGGRGAHPAEESSPSSPPGEHDDLHETHPAA
jgi:hypothetical protein